MAHCRRRHRQVPPLMDFQGEGKDPTPGNGSNFGRGLVKFGGGFADERAWTQLSAECPRKSPHLIALCSDGQCIH